MRLRFGISCATLTCAGAAIGGANCVSSQNASPVGSDASFPEASTLDTSVPIATDAGGAPNDAGADAAPVDSAPPIDAPANAACAPRCGFVPSAYAPSYVPQIGAGPCSGLPLPSAYAEACFEDASTYSSCAGFGAIDAGPDGGACLSCLFQPSSADAGLGAVISGTIPTLNFAGCVQNGDPSDAGFACAAAIQAASACVDFACTASCPVTDNPSRAAYLSCAQQAATGVCSSYTQAANACFAAEVEGGAPWLEVTCVNWYGDAGGAVTLLDFFCGS